MRQMAARVAAAGPIKLDIQPSEGSHPIGSSVSLFAGKKLGIP
jgi:hypothetical protein